MAKQGNRKPEEVEVKPASGGGAVRLFAVGLLVAGAAFFVYAISGEKEVSPAGPATAVSADHSDPARDRGQKERFRFFENPEEAYPLPVTLPPSEFQNQGIANTYRIAKDIPVVLAQQPCLCGCDNTSDDHRSLLDCYRDDHASTCLVCMKEAVLAEQMTQAGRSAKEIREAILRHEFSEVSIGN
jgi:hypothetical protein